MNRVIAAILMIIIAMVLVSSGTFAYFSDTETSTGNTFTDDTLDLKLIDLDETTFRDGVTATWTMTNMIPGVTSTGAFVTLKNNGSTAADHVEISFSHSIDEGTNLESDTNPNSAPSDLAKWIEITIMAYDAVNFLSTPGHNLTDANGNGFIDLDDVTLSPNAGEGGRLDNLLAPSPQGATITTLTIFLKFNAGATNDIQGDTLTTTVTFTLNQDASQ